MDALTRLRTDLGDQLSTIDARLREITGDMVRLDLHAMAFHGTHCGARLEGLVVTLRERSGSIERAIGRLDRGEVDVCVLCETRLRPVEPATATCEDCGRDHPGTYRRRLRVDHGDLRALLAESRSVIDRMVSAIERDEAAADLEARAARVLLGDLERQLGSHFDEEEESGYMSSASATAPRLARQVDALRDEHGTFRVALAELGRRADAAGVAPLAWGGVARRLAEVAAAIAEHEHQENALMADAHWEDIGTAD